MPAWITSELRELVCEPIASSASRITTSRPARASARATARPTTPAPITTASSFSTQQEPLEHEGADAGERRDARHGARRAVEGRAERRADECADGEAKRADRRGGGAGRGREGGKRGGGGVRHDERRAEEQHGEGQRHGEPMPRA